MSAQLTLNLASSEQPELAGWWVAAGSSCPAHELGVLLVVSPGLAAVLKAGGSPAADVRARVACATQMFARAVNQISGLAIRTVALPDMSNDPRTS